MGNALDFLEQFTQIQHLVPFPTDANNWRVCLNGEKMDQYVFIEHDLIVVVMREVGASSYHDTFVAMGAKMFKFINSQPPDFIGFGGRKPPPPKAASEASPCDGGGMPPFRT